MRRVENIVGVTTVLTCALYVRQVVDPFDVALFVFSVAVLGLTSSHSQLHGYKFRWSVLGPAILPCVLLVTAGMRTRYLCLGIIIIWILRSALLRFWYKAAIIGGIYYWIVAFLPLGYTSTDLLSLVIAGFYGALHVITDLSHTEKVFVSVATAAMMRWNYQLLTTDEFAHTNDEKLHETTQTLGCVSIGLSSVALLGLIPSAVHAAGKRFSADKLSHVPKGLWIYAFWGVGWLTAGLAYPLSVMLRQDPLSWIVQYLQKDQAARGVVCLSWLACLCIALPFIHVTSQRLQFRHHLSRKMFHFLAAAMFVLVIENQQALMSLAFGVSLCALLLAEYIRVLHIPLLGPMIQAYYTDFIDSRDNRKLILTHIYLLLGCASTVWLDETLRLRGIVGVPRILPHLGWITIGVGDSMGAIVGVKYGRHRWPSCQRTYEGSLACLLSMGLAVGILAETFQMKDVHPGWMTITLVATTLLEAFTDEIDNLLLPAFSACLYIVGTVPVRSFYATQMPE